MPLGLGWAGPLFGALFGFGPRTAWFVAITKAVLTCPKPPIEAPTTPEFLRVLTEIVLKGLVTSFSLDWVGGLLGALVRLMPPVTALDAKGEGAVL